MNGSLADTTKIIKCSSMSNHDDAAHTAHGAALSDLIVTTFRANGRLLRAGDQLGRDLGLTAARWQVMGAIADEPRTVAQIARYFELTRQGVLWVVSGLVKEGLLELVDNPAHKRAKLVRFTDRGQQVYTDMNNRQAKWANDLATELSVDDVRLSEKVMKKLCEALKY